MTVSDYANQYLLYAAKVSLSLIPQEGNDCDKKVRNDLLQLIQWLESKVASPTP